MDGGCVHDMALAQEIYDDRLVDPLAGSVRLRCGVVGCGFGRVQSSDAAHDRKRVARDASGGRSEEHTSELQSLMRISYAVFCLKKKTQNILGHQYHKQL